MHTKGFFFILWKCFQFSNMNCKNKKGHINLENICKESKSTKYNSICLRKCHHVNFFPQMQIHLDVSYGSQKMDFADHKRELTYLCSGMIKLLSFCPVRHWDVWKIWVHALFTCSFYLPHIAMKDFEFHYLNYLHWGCMDRLVYISKSTSCECEICYL